MKSLDQIMSDNSSVEILFSSKISYICPLTSLKINYVIFVIDITTDIILMFYYPTIFSNQKN